MAMLNNQRVIGFHETFHGIGWILESENLSRRWKSVVNLASWMWKKTWYPKSIGASDGIIMKSIFIQTVMLLSLFIKKSISRFRFKKSGICWSYTNTFEFPSSNMACFLAPFPMTPRNPPSLNRSPRGRCWPRGRCDSPPLLILVKTHGKPLHHYNHMGMDQYL